MWPLSDWITAQKLVFLEAGALRKKGKPIFRSCGCSRSASVAHLPFSMIGGGVFIIAVFLLENIRCIHLVICNTQRFMLKRWLLSFLVTSPWWNHHLLTQVWMCPSFCLSTGALTSVPKTCTFGPLEESGLLQDDCWDRLQQPLEAYSESEEMAVIREKKQNKKSKHVSFYTR